MYIVFIGKLGNLERLSCKNWCIANLGTSGPDTWVAVKPDYDLNMGIEYKNYKHNGMLHGIAFYNQADATAFKLRFGV